MINKLHRVVELKTLLYRLFLAYVFFSISRVLFLLYNLDQFELNSFSQGLYLCYLGLRFDTTSIVYLSSLFILMSILPGTFVLGKSYQKAAKGVYFFGLTLGIFLNFVDIAYYRFNLMRLNANLFESIENEVNKTTLLFHFFSTYFYLVVLFALLLMAWNYFYNKVSLSSYKVQDKKTYSIESAIFFIIVVVTCIGGVRGGKFLNATRPIATIHTMEKIKNPQHADILLNSSFSIFRTLGKTGIHAKNQYSQEEVEATILPFKQYAKSSKDSISPNIVLFIIESFGKEYWGAFNETTKIPNYVSYTPFLDSLAQHSLRFTNFFANGRKSNHAMPSILAGISTFKTAYTASPYVLQPLESALSILNEKNYDTSFFHGAPNGSMGLLGFSSVLGYDHYYGKDEYGNDDDFDGYWGIWDEPFLGYVKTVLDTKQSPFFSTIFTVTSHEPYIIPAKYKGKFPKGNIPMHQCVGYTDYAIQQFFKQAKEEDWFENTVFLFTADHSNQNDYDYYGKPINRFANSFMIYSPKGTYKGVNEQLSQHIDIYPTLVDLVDYDKPFRSWGQSLLSDPVQAPYVVDFFGENYFIMDDQYILVSDGERILGFYKEEDRGLQNNLKDQNPPEMNLLNEKLKMFIQDYMNRITSGELSSRETSKRAMLK